MTADRRSVCALSASRQNALCLDISHEAVCPSLI